MIATRVDGCSALPVIPLVMTEVWTASIIQTRYTSITSLPIDWGRASSTCIQQGNQSLHQDGRNNKTLETCQTRTRLIVSISPRSRNVMKEVWSDYFHWGRATNTFQHLCSEIFLWLSLCFGWFGWCPPVVRPHRLPGIRISKYENLQSPMIPISLTYNWCHGGGLLSLGLGQVCCERESPRDFVVMEEGYTWISGGVISGCR